MKIKKLYVVGSGQDPLNHLTLQAVRACKDAEKLLIICGKATQVLQAIGGHENHEDIMGLYVDGAIDNENYRRIIDKILCDLETHKTVAITTAGHPILGVSWWERLKKHPRFKAELIYVEGISSLTTMFVELCRDPLETGSIIIDANRCLIFEQEINPELDLYIFNFCSTGTRKTHISNPSKDNKLSLLKDHLLKYYPNDTVVRMVSAAHSKKLGEIIQVRIDSLEELLPDVQFYSSLYIPALSPTRYNKDFIKCLIGI